MLYVSIVLVGGASTAFSQKSPWPTSGGNNESQKSPWPTSGGNSERQNKSPFSLSGAPLTTVAQSATWNPCHAPFATDPASTCYFNSFLLANSHGVLLHYSSVLGLNARSISNLSLPLWSMPLGPAPSGRCFAFSSTDGVDDDEITALAVDSDARTVSAYVLASTNTKSPSGREKPTVVISGVDYYSCFVQLDSKSTMFATQARSQPPSLHVIQQKSTEAVVTIALQPPSSGCILKTERDPVAHQHLYVFYTCGDASTILAAYAVTLPGSALQDEAPPPSATLLWHGVVGPDFNDYAATRTRLATTAGPSFLFWDTNGAQVQSEKRVGAYTAADGTLLFEAPITSSGNMGGSLATLLDASLNYAYVDAAAGGGGNISLVNSIGVTKWTTHIGGVGSTLIFASAVLTQANNFLVLHYGLPGGLNTLAVVDATTGETKVVNEGMVGILPPNVAEPILVEDDEVIVWLGGSNQIVHLTR